jgi:CHAT domain-containing protein/tetratricopeptide (TPR) repeat protein
MRGLAVFICLVMFSGLNAMSVAAGSNRGGKPWQQKKSGAGEDGAASEAPGGKGIFRARIEALMKAGKYKQAKHLAEKVLDRQEKRLGPDAPQVAGTLQILANIDMQLHQTLKAIGLYQRALQIREKKLGPEDPKTASTQAHLGWAYVERGLYDKALPLLERSLATRERVTGPDSLETAQSLTMLAGLKRQMGANAQALSLAQRALKIREKKLGPDHPQTAHIMDILAMIYQQQGVLDKALPLAEKSLKIKEKALGPNHPETAKSQRVLGVMQQGRKDYAQAESSFRKGQKGRQGLGGIAEIYLSTGRYAQALETLDAMDLKARARPQMQAQFYTQRGQALQGLGRRGEAAADYLMAIDAIEGLRAHTPGERSGFFQAGTFKGYYQTYLALIGLLAEMAQKGEPLPQAFQAYGRDAGAAAFYFAESVKARALLETMAAKARTGQTRDVPPDLAAKERKLQSEWQALQGRWDEVYQPHKGRERDVEMFLAEQKDLEKTQENLIEELRRRVPRYAALYYPKPYKTQELPLKPGETLLEYTLGQKESFLFRVEPGGRTTIIRLAVSRQDLEKRLGSLLAPFRSAGLTREDLARFPVKELAALYKQLLSPALTGVSPGRHLIIVPDGVLGAFPFEAVVVQQAPTWQKSVLVGDRWPVIYSQSAAILALNRHLGLSKASQPLFALGDCIYAKDSSRYLTYKAGRGQAGALKESGSEKPLTMAATGKGWGKLEFPPLPQTRQTVTDLANLFQVKPQPPQVLLDVNATETRLRQAPLGKYRYLFFGTHGFLADKLAGVKEPTLVLSQVENKAPDDGFLTFSNVLRLKLDADLVTLAACMTGVGQVMQGEGVLNFARAFQQAGARSVMVALWNIPVNESLKFYSTFYKALKEGKPRVEALKLARQAVRAKEPHPYFWSGLILHGEG